MSLFNVDLRRESVKAAQALGTLLGERVNKAAWKSYVPAIVDLIIAADRGDETAADKVDALLVDGITMNDIIAIGAACKVVGITGEDQVYKIVYKLGNAAHGDKEFVDRMHAAIGGYQAATAFVCEADPVAIEKAVGVPRDNSFPLAKTRAELATLIEATSTLSKKKQTALVPAYVQAASRVLDWVDVYDGDLDMATFSDRFKAALIAEMETAGATTFIIDAYKAWSAQNAAEAMAFAGYENA